MGKPRLRAVSLGLGVQTTTMLLMIKHGELPPVDAAIVADTEGETLAIYEHLAWLQSPNVALPFPIHVVSAGNLMKRTQAAIDHEASNVVPFYTTSPDGNRGQLIRGCTRDFKINPVRKKVRELLGYGPKERIPEGSAEVWIGITTDELIRATPSCVNYITNRFPFLGLVPGDPRMNRWDCKQWLRRNDYPIPPASGCKCCPFTDNEEWRRRRDNSPEEFEESCRLDEAARKSGFKGLKMKPYLHDSLKPLRDVDLRSAQEKGQFSLLSECSGMCRT